MKNCRACAVCFVCLVSLFVSCASVVAETTFSVGPAAKTIRNALLEVEVSPPSATAVPRLVDSATGKETPCQSHAAGNGRTRVAWVVKRLEQGKTASWSLWWRGAAPATSVEIEKSGDGAVDVKIGGDLFTRYLHGGDQFKPYLYPIFLDGVALTRHFPMKDGVEGERYDHRHHRSFYFTHGEVNGVSYWHEGDNAGHIYHREFELVRSGPVKGVIKTRSEWIDPGGKKILDDHRVHYFYSPVEGVRVIDFRVTLTASSGPVIFGDTKEGSFGIRVAGWMKQTSGGRIRSSRGADGAGAAWGKPAEWIDYTGKLDGKTYGVAILDHPRSFRSPTHWHVRDYGLFAANPFGYHNFYNRKTKDGEHTLAKGESVTFKYRIVFHRGSTEDSHIDEMYSGWATPPEVKVVSK